MEMMPGARAKIKEYVERIQNGEDKEWVLQGVGSSFRDPVEEILSHNTEQKTVSNNIDDKEGEWISADHAKAMEIRDTLSNIAESARLGLQENTSTKIQQYANEIRSGKSKSYVLSGLPQGIIDAVEMELSKNSTEETLK